jgi:type VI secretion system protein ImpB
MAESTQHKLDRVRPPRVQITYDVQVGDAIEMKELPFVVGIMSDLAGTPGKPLLPLKERKFINLDKDNFDDVMAGIKPGLALRVDNKLEPESDTQLNVALTFDSLADFNPASIVRQVEPLRKLYEARQRLTDLLAKLDGNDALDGLLQNIIGNTDELNQLKAQLGGTGNGEEN